MKLIRVILCGYKRFNKISKVDLNAKVVAVIGPNESGKSSLLKALNHLNSDGGFEAQGSAHELTRGKTAWESDEVIQAEFLLEKDDKNALSSIPEAIQARWLKVYKDRGGDISHSVDPTPYRSLKLRTTLVRQLGRLVKHKLYAQDVTLENDEIVYSVNQTKTLITALNTTDQDLSDAVINQVKALNKFITLYLDSSHPKYVRGLPDKLDELISYESASNPHDRAIDVLMRRKPQFLFFNENERSLKSSYDLATEDLSQPALANLASLANLDLGDLKTAIEHSDQAKIDTLTKKANDQLIKVFKTAWSQTCLTVRLDTNGTILHLLVKEDGPSVSITERSDGLQQFVALVAFISKKQVDRKLILLIDEAETHLHYDAQADLTQIFARQELIDNVIYSTHSVGCLPEDLGTGVRLVEPTGEEESTIKNWFWENADPGFSPLLFGMGATTLAFFPVRHALIAEGPSDLILLPTLLREALGRRHLGFQVVPGLSNASDSGFKVLTSNGKNIAFLVDSDSGGKSLNNFLKNNGVSSNRIFEFSDVTKNGSAVEDFVTPIIYLDAVNKVLDRYQETILSVAEKDLPRNNRSVFIRNQCKKIGINEPSKRAVAYQILEHRHEAKILWPKRAKALQTLYEKINTALSNA